MKLENLILLATLGFGAYHDIERKKTIEREKAYALAHGLPEPVFEPEISWFWGGILAFIIGFLVIVLLGLALVGAFGGHSGY